MTRAQLGWAIYTAANAALCIGCGWYLATHL